MCEIIRASAGHVCLTSRADDLSDDILSCRDILRRECFSLGNCRADLGCFVDFKFCGVRIGPDLTTFVLSRLEGRRQLIFKLVGDHLGPRLVHNRVLVLYLTILLIEHRAWTLLLMLLTPLEYSILLLLLRRSFPTTGWLLIIGLLMRRLLVKHRRLGHRSKPTARAGIPHLVQGPHALRVHHTALCLPLRRHLGLKLFRT